MVLSALHNLDPKPLSRNTSGAVGPQLLHKPVVQTKVCATEKKCFNNGKGRAVKLNPLNVAAQNKEALSSEKKYGLNVAPRNLNGKTETRCKGLPSKIPVLQKPLLNATRKNVDAHCDTTLSAADKRQKFHQSRLGVAPPCSTTSSSFLFKFNKLTPYDFIPWYDASKINAIHYPYSTPTVQSQKLILPPVKDSVPATRNELNTSSQGKKKNLLGEITHFPALCNVAISKTVRKSESSVPHLPSIHSPPAPPPPSISSSLEQNLKPNEVAGDLKKMQDRHATRPVIFQMLVPVGLC